MVEEFLDKNQKNKDEQVKNLEWSKLKALLGEKSLDRQSKEKQHSEELGFKSDQLQAQKQQNSFDNKLKLGELIGKKPSKKSIYSTVAENFGSKGYGAFFKGLFSALGHKDQEEMSEKQASEMMKYLQQAEAIDYIKNTNEQLDQMQKKAQLQKQADEYFQTNYQKLMATNLPISEKQKVTGELVNKAGDMAGEQKTLDGIGVNGDMYVKNQKGNIIKVAGDPVENALSNYRDLQNNYQYPQANSSNPYQKLVNDQHQTRINYDPNGRMRTQQPQNPMQVQQPQENLQQDSQQEQPKEEPWMANMDMAKNNVDSRKNADQYSEKEKQPYYVREAQRLYFEDQRKNNEFLQKAQYSTWEQESKNLNQMEDGENIVVKNYRNAKENIQLADDALKTVEKLNINGGKLQQAINYAQSMLGGEITADLKNMQAFQTQLFGAMNAKMMKGQMTDKDLAFLLQGVPSSGMPKVVAQRILENFKKLQENKKNEIQTNIRSYKELSDQLGIKQEAYKEKFSSILHDINNESQQQNSATQAQNFSGSSFKKVKGGYVLVR